MYRLYARRFDQVLNLFGIRLPWRRHCYQEFWALRDVDVKLRKGERVGIIGRNGAGKSTLLKIIAGALTPTQGSVTVNGKVQALMELGTGFHPDFSGRENIFASLAYQGVTGRPAQHKFAEIVDFSELEDFIEQPIKTYSAGMYARLAFSVATSVQPEILIIDEVLGAGDAYFASKCIERMRQLTEESGATVLFVSHDLASVQRLCTCALWLDRGRLLLDGDTLTVSKAYAAAVREQEEVRLRAKNLGLSRKTLSALTPLQSERQLIGHFVTASGLAPQRRHAIHHIALYDEGRCLKEVLVGDAMDSDVSQAAYVITSPGYINWSEPARVDGRYARFFEDRNGQYLHAAFAFTLNAVERLSSDAKLEVTRLIDSQERVLVELYDGERYVPLGELSHPERQGWETFSFSISPGILQKLGIIPEPVPRSHPDDREPSLRTSDAHSGEPHARQIPCPQGDLVIQDCYGSGEIELTGVELLGGEGQPRAVFTTGETLVVRLQYRARVPVRDPVFVIAIYRLDGVVVNQSISSKDGVHFGTLEGEGYVNICFAPLLIGRGKYVLSAAIFPVVDLLDVYGRNPYSLHDRRYELMIEQPLDCAIELGLVHHPVEWGQLSMLTSPRGWRSAMV
ncbi:MAG: ABC transporter ATP-binding protein [Candidatus Methylomirabilis oxyfera]|nr:ABC transporter ATP-binding protein [Candidatus Methylomirabilis oxyfera]